MGIKTIIAGGRDFGDYFFMDEKLLMVPWEITEVVVGGAKGADFLGERWAINNKKDLIILPAMWDKYGKSAGYVRNSEMADYSEALIAFWDGKSKGTKNMISTAIKKGLYVKVVKYGTAEKGLN